MPRELGKVAHHVGNDRPRHLNAGVQRTVDRVPAGTPLRVVGESVEWRQVLRKATQVAPDGHHRADYRRVGRQCEYVSRRLLVVRCDEACLEARLQQPIMQSPTI
jgi:hypothetical protein